MTTTLNFNNIATFNDNKLHSSVASGQLNLVQRLISNGYDPNSPHSTTGLRPIHFAASRGHVDLVQFLVESSQVQIDTVDKEGETALLKAAYTGFLSVVKYLVQTNANYLHQDRDGWTALHNACSCGNVDMVRFLLNLPNVNVNIQSKQGHTPLMNAASKGFMDIVILLLNDENNANPLLKNKFGETAYDVAAAAGEAYLCQVIEQHEFKWHNNHLLPFNSLNMHVTIPVLLIEEQQITVPLLNQPSSSYNITNYLPYKKSSGQTTNATIITDSTWYFHGESILNKSKVELPNTNWFWLSDWTIDHTIPRVKNNDGWSYSQNSINMEDENNWFAELPLSDNSSNWIRRRQWMRIMKKVIHTDYDASISSGGNNSSSSDDDSDDSSDLNQHTTSTSNRQHYTNRKKTLSSVSTTMTKAQSIFIGCSTHPQPLLQEQISIIIPNNNNNTSVQQEEQDTNTSTDDDALLLSWESNDQALDCRRCHRWFNFIVRRHHCRKCGQVICDKCSTHRAYLPPTHIIQPPNIPIQDLRIMSLRPQRICDQCIDDVNNSDLIIRKKKKRRSSVMLECPVCTMKLTDYNTTEEQEQHVQACLNRGQSSSVSIGIRFVVYKLTNNSTLIGQECVICFEEFESDDTITRLNCMCSYHRHCINNWFSKGKECPIHSQ